MAPKKPMIDPESRPSPIDYEASIADWKVRDLLAVVRADMERIKPEQLKPEYAKPEHYKPEQFKPERIKPEQLKPEKFKPEDLKVEKEYIKPEKEGLKPEKEFTPEWELEVDVLVDRIANKVVEILKGQGVIR